MSWPWRGRDRARHGFWCTVIAYLLRVRRENPRSIVALTYNRHAAVDIRQRIAQQVGQDARGVTILTCHSLGNAPHWGQLQ